MSNENEDTDDQSTKEKRNWFLSLTRRKKNLAAQTNNNNNNDEPRTSIQNSNSTTVESSDHNVSRQREKNFLQRIRKKIGSMRRRANKFEIAEANGTTDATEEFVTTSSPIQPEELTFSFVYEPNMHPEDEDMIPFSHDYRRFIRKKWSPNGDNENDRIMHKACSEMLNKVWYWGKISRHYAQNQLKNKPAGTFLVRDSETSGCFTLSFRISNHTLHNRLIYRERYWRFEELQYESLVEMIEDINFRSTNDSLVCFVKGSNEIEPPFPVILKYPLSRYSKMPQLQDLCRRAIQRNLTPEEISCLPIPSKLLDYLGEKRELVFSH